MLKPCNINPQKMISFYVGTGGILKGQLAMVDSDTAIDATAGQNTAILIGVAAETYEAGDVGLFYPLDDEFEIPLYQGGSIDIGSAALVGTGFDLKVGSSGEHELDLNDESGEMFILQRYDNEQRIAWVRVIKALILC